MEIKAYELTAFLNKKFSNMNDWKRGKDTIIKFSKGKLIIMDGLHIFEDFTAEEIKQEIARD